MIDQPGLARFAAEIKEIWDRIYSLERRFRDLAMVRFFIDLADVQERTEEHAPLTPGDVWGLNDDGKWDIITPAGGGGGESSGSTRIDATGGGSVGPGDPPASWSTAIVWGNPQNQLLTLDGTEGAMCEANFSGTYIVSGSFVATGTDFTVARLSTADQVSWVDGETAPGACFLNEIRYSGDAVTELTITGQLAVPDQGVIYAFCNQEADLRLTLHRVSDEVFVPCSEGEPDT